MVNLTIDGQEVQVEEGTTILEAARRIGIEIPHLCYHPDLTPYGACRVCVVEVIRHGRSVVTTSCDYPVEEDIEVKTNSPRALQTRKMMVELLLARCPNVRAVRKLAAELGIEKPRFPTDHPEEDCILCGLCVRACHEIARKDVLGFVDRGPERKVTTAFEIPSEECIGCNICVPYCPTGAIAMLPGIVVKGVGRIWVRLRQLVQYLALALFLYLFVSMTREGGSPIPVNLFSRFDPLLALSSMLAARRVILAFAPALVLTLATLALGRFWCGWICPLGTVLNLFGPVKRNIPQKLRQAKYYILFIILFAALLANLTLVFLDPITIFLRALAGVIYPGIKSVLEKGAKLPMQPALIIPFAVILALNLIVRRFWCRYLCPLGALLGLLSKIAWVKRYVDEKTCFDWGRCIPTCPMGTIDEGDLSSDPAECIMCLDCLGSCPAGATKFGRKPGLSWGYEYDPSRRQLLASLATGVLGALLLRTKLFRWKSPHLLRPPGARPEEEFLAKCVHCGQCLKVCPNHALRPTLLEAGLEGFWTPMLVPRSGFCDYDCNACGQVCPTGAIPALPLEEKRKQVIGTAYVNRDRCISCMMCKGVCPVGAIEEVEGEREGMPALFPQVNPDLCIGCGTCEYTCPVEGEAAIRVYAPGARPVRPAPPPVPTPTPEATKAPEKTPTPEETPTIKASEKRAYVNRDLCLRCFICVMLCPQHAIEKVMVDDVEYPHVIVEKCIGCGICEENCPAEPKAIRLYAPEELPESWRPLTRRA